MASQNLPGVAAIRAAGYGPDAPDGGIPVSKVITLTGLATLVLAPFGAFALNLSAITAAICMGREAHEDPARRWVAAAAAGVVYIVLGLLGGAVVVKLLAREVANGGRAGSAALWTRVYDIAKESLGFRLSILLLSVAILMSIGSAMRFARRLWTMEEEISRRLPYRITDAPRDGRHHATVIRRNGGAVPGFRAPCCPYCGHTDALTATVRVGSKRQLDNLPVTEAGYVVPTARGSHVELLLLKCGHLECNAIIDPLAYHSPATFFADKENISLLDDEYPQRGR
jgi:hypothetical protein